MLLLSVKYLSCASWLTKSENPEVEKEVHCNTSEHWMDEDANLIENETRIINYTWKVQ